MNARGSLLNFSACSNVCDIARASRSSFILKTPKVSKIINVNCEIAKHMRKLRFEELPSSREVDIV